MNGTRALEEVETVTIDPTSAGSVRTYDLIKSMDVGPNDVFLASFPKSGTTWLLHIVYHIMHNGKSHTLQSHTLQSHTLQSHTLQSHTLQSHTLQSR